MQREFEAELAKLGEAEEEEEEEDDEEEEEEGGGGGAGNADLEEFGKDLEEEFAEEEEEAAEAAAVAARAAASRKNANPNRKHKVVKRTVYFNNPDGTRWKRVELITDFKKVQQYVRSKKSEHKGRLVRAENHEKRKDQLAQARAKRKIHKEAKSDEQQKADDIKDAQQKLAHFQIYQDWVAKGSDKKNLPHIGTGNSGKGAKSCSICACTGDAWTGIRRDGSSHLGLLLTGPNHPAVHRAHADEQDLPAVRRGGLGPGGPPVQAEEGAGPKGRRGGRVMAYSCNPCG